MNSICTLLPASFQLPPLKGCGSGVEGKAAHDVEVELEGKWKLEGASTRDQAPSGRKHLVARSLALILEIFRSRAPAQHQVYAGPPIADQRGMLRDAQNQHRALPRVRRRRMRTAQALDCPRQCWCTPDVGQIDAEPAMRQYDRADTHGSLGKTPGGVGAAGRNRARTLIHMLHHFRGPVPQSHCSRCCR
jgi:hypothetical protein